MPQRILAMIAWMFFTGTVPALAQTAPPPAASRADEIDARFDQAHLLIRQINRLVPGPEKSAAIEELRGQLAQIDAAFTDAEKADHARRKLAALRDAVERQRQRLKQSGSAMAQASVSTMIQPKDFRSCRTKIQST